MPVYDPYGGQPATGNLMMLPLMADNPFEAILAPFLLSRDVWEEYFGFTLTWNAANGNQITANLAGAGAQTTLDPGIDFILKRITLVALVQAASPVQAAPDLDLALQERSGASNFSDIARHINLWTGSYRNSDPLNLPFPRYIRGSNTILGQITNNTGAVYTRVQLGLEGVRVTYMNESRVNRNMLFGVVA